MPGARPSFGADREASDSCISGGGPWDPARPAGDGVEIGTCGGEQTERGGGRLTEQQDTLYKNMTEDDCETDREGRTLKHPGVACRQRLLCPEIRGKEDLSPPLLDSSMLPPVCVPACLLCLPAHMPPVLASTQKLTQEEHGVTRQNGLDCSLRHSARFTLYFKLGLTKPRVEGRCTR